jgi:hypothetical protein
MKRALAIALLTLAALTVRPAPAAADATAFYGFSPTVANRSATGFSVGLSLLVVGFEFEYAHVNEDSPAAASGVSTGMVNVLLMTPTKLQLYVTAGAGVGHETLLAATNTDFGTNIGGGIKIPIAGPIRVRIDYRAMHLTGTPFVKNVQRFYAGINFAF